LKRVFDAFATEQGKAGWFSGEQHGAWELVEKAFDFREGGEERLVGRWRDGKVSDFHARYLDILPGERIVYVYEMRLNGTKISASLATLEFTSAADGTRLKVTEQGAFLDGYDDAGSREAGTAQLLEQLGRSLDAG
jgi:uncharacterized protein YndB with AHSA1/START domain